MTVNELLQQRAALLDQAQAIVDEAIEAGRALKSDELLRVDDFRQQATELSALISEQRKENRRQLSLPQRY